MKGILPPIDCHNVTAGTPKSKECDCLKKCNSRKTEDTKLDCIHRCLKTDTGILKRGEELVPLDCHNVTACSPQAKGCTCLEQCHDRPSGKAKTCFRNCLKTASTIQERSEELFPPSLPLHCVNATAAAEKSKDCTCFRKCQDESPDKRATCFSQCMKTKTKTGIPKRMEGIPLINCDGLLIGTHELKRCKCLKDCQDRKTAKGIHQCLKKCPKTSREVETRSEDFPSLPGCHDPLSGLPQPKSCVCLRKCKDPKTGEKNPICEKKCYKSEVEVDKREVRAIRG